MWMDLEKEIPGYGAPRFWFSDYFLAPEFSTDRANVLYCCWHLIRAKDCSPLAKSATELWSNPSDEVFRAMKARDAQIWADGAIRAIQ